LAPAQAANTTTLSVDEALALDNLRASQLPIGQLVDHLLDLVDEAADPETGELRHELGAAIDKLNLSLQVKVQAYAHVAERLKAEASAYDDLAQHYRAKAERQEREVKLLKQRLQAELERLGTDRVKTQTVTAYLQASPRSVELLALDDSDIPDAFCVVERRVSASKILAALKSGAELAFARLAPVSKHVRFR
jgi:hypothetical protein